MKFRLRPQPADVERLLISIYMIYLQLTVRATLNANTSEYPVEQISLTCIALVVVLPLLFYCPCHSEAWYTIPREGVEPSRAEAHSGLNRAPLPVWPPGLVATEAEGIEPPQRLSPPSRFSRPLSAPALRTSKFHPSRREKLSIARGQCGPRRARKVASDLTADIATIAIGCHGGGSCRPGYTLTSCRQAYGTTKGSPEMGALICIRCPNGATEPLPCCGGSSGPTRERTPLF